MTPEHPAISARTLAIIDEAIGLRLRRHYRASDPDVYRDLLTIAVIAKAWSITRDNASRVGVATHAAGSLEELTTTEAATRAGVTADTIRWNIRHGRLRATRRAGRWFVSAESLAAYMLDQAA